MRTNTWALLTLALALCGPGCEDNTAGNGEWLAALQPAASCEDAVVAIRQRMINDMNQQIDDNLASALAQLSCDWTWYPPASASGSSYDGGVMQIDAGASPSASADAGSGSPSTGGSTAPDSPDEHSDTNTQVKDVDEADFVENDGAYIYILAHGKFRIVDSWPAAEANEIAAVPIAGTPTRMFVDGDRAVVYAAVGPIWRSNDPYGSYSTAECTYGYECEFTGDGQALRITVLDLTDRRSPVVRREIDFNGSYLNSRRINNVVHTVVSFPEASAPLLEYWPTNLDLWSVCYDDGYGHRTTELDVRVAFETLRRQNRARIEALTAAQLLPTATDTPYVDGQPTAGRSLFEGCRGFYISQAGDGSSLLTLLSFDDRADADLGLTTIVGRPGVVYATLESLYIADRHSRSEMSQWYYEPGAGIDEATTVHKFHLGTDGSAAIYVASGVAKGRFLNQFSLDEYDSNLRLATTTGHLPGEGVYNTVSVMAQDGATLHVIGQLDHLAPSEDIRSVRFDGPTVYLVTFKKTDPLFVIDLSDPQHPVLRGELEMPGFSTYMQPIDDTHVLAIGFDADDQGSFAWFQGLQLQLFDVSDPENPTLLYKEVIGSRGTGSAAATNHLAFNYFAPKSLLAIPVNICQGSGGSSSYGETLTFSGLLVYRVTAAEGFVRLGGIPHVDPTTVPADPYGTNCGMWWTDSDSEVQRSIFMDDYVYSIALDLIQVAALTDLEHPVASIDLTD